MAIRDWNGDGKKDWADNVIEYQVYKNMRDHKNMPTGNSSGGMSFLGVVLCLLAGFFWEAVLFTKLGLEVKDVPGILFFLVWIAFSVLTGAVVKKLWK